MEGSKSKVPPVADGESVDQGGDPPAPDQPNRLRARLASIDDDRAKQKIKALWDILDVNRDGKVERSEFEAKCRHTGVNVFAEAWGCWGNLAGRAFRPAAAFGEDLFKLFCTTFFGCDTNEGFTRKQFDKAVDQWGPFVIDAVHHLVTFEPLKEDELKRIRDKIVAGMVEGKGATASIPGPDTLVDRTIELCDELCWRTDIELFQIMNKETISRLQVEVGSEAGQRKIKDYMVGPNSKDDVQDPEGMLKWDPDSKAQPKRKCGA